MRYLVGAAVLGLAACGSVKSKAPDGATCTPESDTAFCTRIAKTCESQTADDNCGMPRTADCGTCDTTHGCVVGVCKTPVCTTFNYTSAVLPAFSRASVEDGMAAATPDGQVIIYSQSQQAMCGSFHTILADETAPGSGTYTSQDITAALTTLGVFIGQEGYTIAADGLTLIGKSADGKTWLSTTRTAIHQIGFGATSTVDFAAINATIASNAGVFRAPEISADQLEFFYTVNGVDANTDGIYSAVRASTTVPFPAGTRLPPPVQDNEFVVGVSSDRLTLFLFSGFSSHILTRSSTNGPWVNPNAPAAPPIIGGWEHKPLADCVHLVGMSSPGGCAAEDIFVYTRQ